MNDTITAISTSSGVAAISIVRMSGNEAIKIANSIFKGKDLMTVPSHTIHYGHIYDNDETIDEVLVSVMRSPKTFTREDVVEISCHGGINPTNRILALILSKGVRLAEPGEFAKRAFLNGRIDLIEAEGIMDLIKAKTDKMRKLAINQVGGKTSDLIRKLRQKIRDILINIDVNIDYPEYEDILVITKEMIDRNLIDIKREITRILNESENSKLIKEGIKTVIVGKPNVGKSSILNHLIDEEKAIVTNIPGTTRDIVEGDISIDGIILNIVDTAGIRQTSDVIEQIGVNKSLKMIDTADLIIVVLNNNEEATTEDLEILEKTKGNKRIIFINKNDLDSKLDYNLFKDEPIVYGNTIEDSGLESLKEKVKQMFNLDMIDQSDFTYLSNARQIGILREALALVEEIASANEIDIPIDLIAIDLKKVWEILGDIIGETYNNELIDELFRQFCLGK